MLTVKEVEAAKPKETRYLLSDGRGLVLEVMTSGSKIWRYRSRKNGQGLKETIGPFPEITLLEAREMAAQFRVKQARGVDLRIEKKRAMEDAAKSKTLREVAEEWFVTNQWDEIYKTKQRERLERFFLRPWGNRPIREITRAELKDRLLQIQVDSIAKSGNNKGCGELRDRAYGLAKNIFKFAMGEEYIESNISSDILLPPKAKEEHLPAITKPEEVGALLRKIDLYDEDDGTGKRAGTRVVKTALQLQALIFLRSGELVQLEWSFVDWNEKKIHCPARIMKMKRDHYIPASRQVLILLEDLRPLTGGGKYIFPSRNYGAQNGGHMTQAALTVALRRMGFAGQHVGHGFRATFKTISTEARRPDGGDMWSHGAIELQQAHEVGTRVERAYYRGDKWQERVELMAWWSNYLDELREADITTPSCS